MLQSQVFKQMWGQWQCCRKAAPACV